MSTIIFEDHLVSRLHPVSISKAAFTIRCGSFSLLELLKQVDPAPRWIVRPHLAAILKDAGSTSPANSSGDWLLYVNARLVPAMKYVRELDALKRAGRPAIVRTTDGEISAAVVPAQTQTRLAELSDASLTAGLDGLDLPEVRVELPLMQYPHDILRYHMAVLSDSLQYRLAQGDYQEVADGVFAAPDAKLGQHVVTDTTKGPIVLESRSSIGPYCYLSGPVHVDIGARVIEHAALKDCVALGHTTKVGGEVEASIIEPYSNKQHHGFLGHSYLGSWINLGAGTCNSDLKNTYGNVNMEYRGQKVPTGMQFVGCFMGDYAKTAINTGIFTGKTIGVCSMVYGFVTTNVPSFVNYARLFDQVTEAPVEVMIATQARMFARRNVQQRPSDIQLLRDMYELTRSERETGGKVPLTTDPLAL